MPLPSEREPGRTAQLGRGLLWLILAVGLLAAALLATWHAWAAADFGYRYWHGAVGIDTNIERYGPENRFRHGFETTTLDERARLFGAIVDAIHGETHRLPLLRYHGPDGRPIDRLLRTPEVRHLEDVARLVGWLQFVDVIGALTALAAAAVAARRGWPLPGVGAFAGGALAMLATAGAILAAFGPTEVFYALHVWIFPADHQWFFTYQESLMSMMMRAPILFGAIAVEWIASALALFTVLLAGQRWLHRAIASQQPK